MERAIQTVKQRMARCKQGTPDCQQALLELQSTLTKDLPSPAEILHGRPSCAVNGQTPAPQVDMQQIKQALDVKQQKDAKHYKRAKTSELPPLHITQNILIQHKNGNWEPATIT